MAGKGSSPRPMPDRDRFDTNFDAIFGKDKKQNEDNANDKKQIKDNKEKK